MSDNKIHKRKKLTVIVKHLKPNPKNCFNCSVNAGEQKNNDI